MILVNLQTQDESPISEIAKRIRFGDPCPTLRTCMWSLPCDVIMNLCGWTATKSQNRRFESNAPTSILRGKVHSRNAFSKNRMSFEEMHSQICILSQNANYCILSLRMHSEMHSQVCILKSSILESKWWGKIFFPFQS